MGVNLHPALAAKTGTNDNKVLKGARKRKYGVSDLPFTHWDIDSRKWRNYVVPSLLAWAGTQGDPFGTNSQMADEVTALWERAYPAIVLNDARKSIVLGVVRTFRRFRAQTASDIYIPSARIRLIIGEAILGRLATVPFLNCSIHTTHNLIPQRDVQNTLLSNSTGCASCTSVPMPQYVWSNQAKCQTVLSFQIGRGAFCSPLISVVYSTHLRKIASVAQRYGPQIGAIALATIAVCLTIHLISDLLTVLNYLG